MEIDSTEDFLRKFDYKYQRQDNELIVEMDFSQRILIDFSNPENIIITDKLMGWNFLTGIISTSIKSAIVFNLAMGVLLSTVIIFFDLKSGILFFIAMMVWILAWTAFYLSKTETLRRFLINWNKLEKVRS